MTTLHLQDVPLRLLERIATLHLCSACKQMFRRSSASPHRCPFCGDDRLEESV